MGRVENGGAWEVRGRRATARRRPSPMAPKLCRLTGMPLDARVTRRREVVCRRRAQRRRIARGSTYAQLSGNDAPLGTPRAERPRPRFCCGRLSRARMRYDGTMDARGGLLAWWRTARIWYVPRAAIIPSLVIAAMMAVYLGAMMGSYPEGPSVGNVLGSCKGRWGEEQYSLT